MTEHSETSCPDTVLASIAWYPDQLDEVRRGLVESHAAECAACREELAFVQGESVPDIALPDADAAYAQVLGRIERSEVDAQEAPTRSAPLRPRAAFGAGRAALAAGLVLAVLMGGVGLLGGLYLGEPSRGAFEAASAPPDAAAAAAGPLLEVVFRGDAPAESIQAALRAIGGEIVSGPTQLGVFRVKLVPTADASAAARVLRGEGQGVATFAEPVPS